MTDSMVERVARAIDAASYEEGERWRAELPKLARAAIEAMREPTEEIVQAMTEAASAASHDFYYETAWRMGIDAILAEKT